MITRDSLIRRTGAGRIRDRVDLGVAPLGSAHPSSRVQRDRARGVEHRLAKLVPKHDRYGCHAFNEARSALGLPTEYVPQLDEVSELLTPLTGFTYQPVAGLAPLREFYGAFAGRRFSSTQYLRHHSVPLYTPEPDIIHEVIGHANQLADWRFAAICEEVGKAVRGPSPPMPLPSCRVLFWFTLEFGVVFEDEEPKAYGAGILSSFGG